MHMPIIFYAKIFKTQIYVARPTHEKHNNCSKKTASAKLLASLNK